MLRHSGIIGTLIFCVGLSALISAGTAPITNKAKVVRVIDGDTVVVQTQNKEEKIRLACIDAPEKGQPYYTQSRDRLQSLLQSTPIYLTRTKKDFYGRTVGKLYNKRAELINLEMVASGSAWVYRQYLKDCEEVKHDFLEGEYTAKQGKAGLWAEDNPQEPWNFRKNK